MLSFAGVAQQTNTDIRTTINNRHFSFIAQSAHTARGRTINLSSGYDLTLRGDTVVAYLPYYGQVYTAPIDPSEGGIKFTSVSNTLGITEKKKGGWSIDLVPKDAGEYRHLYFDISPDGYATLSVEHINRRPISFYGYVTGLEKQ